MSDKKITSAFILAAGFGTRLKPYTKELPKALVLYNGKPMIENVISKLKIIGITEFYINTHHFAEKINNFLWVSFTRCNPSHDIYGVASFVEHKHWGCKGPVIIDARMKPHHAPPLIKDTAVEKSIDPIFEKGGSLYGILK